MREEGKREKEERGPRGGDQDPQEHMAQMADSVGTRSWDREAHKLEKLRLGRGMRRAERSQVPAWPVMGACYTVERVWRAQSAWLTGTTAGIYPQDPTL